MTASLMPCPRYFSASFLSFLTMIADSSSAEYPFPLKSRWNSPLLLPISRLTKSTIFSGSETAFCLASVPTMALLPSNRMTEGVIRSLSELGMICGLPYASMWAIAQKVVPRSMPIALRTEGVESGDALIQEASLSLSRVYAIRMFLSFLRTGGHCHQVAFLILLNHDFLGSDHPFTPQETRFQAADDIAVLLRCIGQLDRNGPLIFLIELPVSGFNLGDFHARHDFHDKIDGVIQVMAEVGEEIESQGAFSRFFGDARVSGEERDLPAYGRMIVEKADQIAHKRLLKHFQQESVAVPLQFFVESVEELLVYRAPFVEGLLHVRHQGRQRLEHRGGVIELRQDFLVLDCRPGQRFQPQDDRAEHLQQGGGGLLFGALVDLLLRVDRQRFHLPVEVRLQLGRVV